MYQSPITLPAIGYRGNASTSSTPRDLPRAPAGTCTPVTIDMSDTSSGYSSDSSGNRKIRHKRIKSAPGVRLIPTQVVANFKHSDLPSPGYLHRPKSTGELSDISNDYHHKFRCGRQHRPRYVEKTDNIQPSMLLPNVKTRYPSSLYDFLKGLKAPTIIPAEDTVTLSLSVNGRGSKLKGKKQTLVDTDGNKNSIKSDLDKLARLDNLPAFLKPLLKFRHRLKRIRFNKRSHGHLQNIKEDSDADDRASVYSIPGRWSDAEDSPVRERKVTPALNRDRTNIYLMNTTAQNMNGI